jgi:proteasome accessory factor A
LAGRSKLSVPQADAGTIDLHYRDYEEPPGNGGFLLNGGRLYLDMGHIEYASPECLHLHDLVTYELAGDDLLQSALIALGAEDRVSFIKNNVDHHTGATFGCHENYLMRREAQFTPPILGTLLTFLATRQIFTGAGRVGQSNPLAFDFEPPQPEGQVNFQLSQRADHIVNDIYQWVQFNRAIINARDEPLADYRKYRRLHLLIGDSNMSEYAMAEDGTTARLICSKTHRAKESGPDGCRATTLHRQIWIAIGAPGNGQVHRPSRQESFRRVPTAQNEETRGWPSSGNTS